MLKVAFIGAGRMANAHAAQLQKIENVEIAGVYDIDRKKAGFLRSVTEFRNSMPRRRNCSETVR